MVEARSVRFHEWKDRFIFEDMGLIHRTFILFRFSLSPLATVQFVGFDHSGKRRESKLKRKKLDDHNAYGTLKPRLFDKREEEKKNFFNCDLFFLFFFFLGETRSSC